MNEEKYRRLEELGDLEDKVRSLIAAGHDPAEVMRYALGGLSGSDMRNGTLTLLGRAFAAAVAACEDFTWNSVQRREDEDVSDLATVPDEVIEQKAQRAVMDYLSRQ